MRTLHLFAGAGGGILADILLGHRPVCAVEIDPYCRSVLDARMRDGSLPWFPVFDDVRTFDGKRWRGFVDCVSGGFPCQDISAIGKGAGIDGERSGLWSEMARIVFEVRPRYVFVENSPRLVRRGLHRVIADLAEMGFDARWGVLGASGVGAPHERERCWIRAVAPGVPVRFAHECDECECCDDLWCPECNDHFADCRCIGPTQDGVEYDATGLWATKMADPDSEGLEGHARHGDDRDQSRRFGQEA